MLNYNHIPTTQNHIFRRVNRMKRIRLIIAIFIMAAITLHGCSYEHQHEFKRISFVSGEALGEENSVLKSTITGRTKIENLSVEEYSDTFPIWNITSHEVTKAEGEAFIEHLGLGEGRYYQLGNGNHFDSNDGKFKVIYSRNEISLDYIGSESDLPEVTKSDEEIIAEARRVFESINIIPDSEYECVGVIGYRGHGESTAETITRKYVAFRRILDGVRVLGNDFVYIDVGENGVISIDIHLFDYEKTGELEMIPIADAVKRIDKSDGFGVLNAEENGYEGAADKLTVESTYMVFYNQYINGCEILQPIYSISGTVQNASGKTEFLSRIIAIPERYTHE